ncbi:hypothetical protein JYU34_009547 [Plutella xylostella]|uniref:BHLH domain-containing protein n=1 Tax=Plutella xylostella TaxID=51655 RepID=A0ABQ7QL37_PLUXY|nr:hypothetical protein JYU34_009547 [Plutella xylostella]
MLHEMQLAKPAEYFVSQRPHFDAPKMVPIAPAPDKRSLTLDLNVDRRKYNYKNTAYTGVQSVSIARRNARERNRVKQVNDGFNALRKRLPAAVIAALSGGARRGSGKKLSKVDTLRMVVEYIRHLEGLIEESDEALGIPKQATQVSPMEAYHQDVDEGVFAGRVSPYSDSVPSPVDSECSSGVSSAYSGGSNYFINSLQTSTEQHSPMEDDELLDAISWWQHK